MTFSRCPRLATQFALSPHHAALTLRFAKKHSSKVRRLPRKMTLEVLKVLRLPREMQIMKTLKYCACHTEWLWHIMKKHVGMSQSATPATQDYHRCHNKTRESRRDMLEAQKEHFVLDPLKFSQFAATKLTFSYEFSYEPANKIDVSCEASVNFITCQKMPRPPEFARCHAALTMRFAKNVTRHVWSAAPATQNDDGGLQSLALATKSATLFLETTRKYCGHRMVFDTLWDMLDCHEVPRLPRKTRLRNVVTSKSDRFWSTPHSHRHSTIIANGCKRSKRLQTVAGGCEHKSSVDRTPLHPQTPKVKPPRIRE